MRDAFGRDLNGLPDEQWLIEHAGQACDACGSALIERGSWTVMGPLYDADERAAVVEGAGWLGVPFEDGLPWSWRCRNCGNIGVFGRTEFTWG